MSVLFVHGWGFGPEVWDSVRAGLPDVETRALNLGFFGESDLEAAPPTVAVGHSLGVLWLLIRRPEWCGRLVSVNGFPRFLAAPDFAGVHPRFLARMAARLPDDPMGVLNAFRARCGADATEAAPDVARLAEGLDLLRDGEARGALAGKRVLALAGADDPIVPAAMTEAAFPRQIIRWQPGGHMLPLGAPDAVIDAVRELLA